MVKLFITILEKISKQIGDGNLLSQLTKKTVVYNFRQNDIKKWRRRSSINANISSD